MPLPSLRRPCLPVLGLLLALLTGGPAAAAAGHETHRFYGYAFDDATGKYLYTEVHSHQYDGDHWLSGSVRYFGPDNRLIGEKTLDFSQDPYVPVFRMRMPAEHYEEAITAVTASGIEMEKSIDGRREHDRIDRNPGMVADAGFHSFVVDHLDDLQKGKSVQFPFVVAGRLASYRFRLVKAGESMADGHVLLRLRGEADSLLRLVAPALSLTYDLSTHYLVEYRGVSNLHDPATGKAYPAVRIVFPTHAPAGAPSTLPPFEG